MSITQNMLNAMVKNKIEFVTTVPCKQLSGIIELLEEDERILHVPSNKEDEGMGLCAGAYMGGKVQVGNGDIILERIFILRVLLLHWLFLFIVLFLGTLLWLTLQAGIQVFSHHILLLVQFFLA